MFVLSYKGPNFTEVAAVKVDVNQADAYIATLPDDGSTCAIKVQNVSNLSHMSWSLLGTLYNALAETPVKKFDSADVARGRLFALLERASTSWEPTEAQEPAEGTTSTETINEEEADLAANKTKTKKPKTPKAPKAPKVAKEKKVRDGLPRPGTKKAELLRLLQRQNGATMEEMIGATGWKVVSTRMKEAAASAGLKLKTVRGTDGKPTRWYAE